MTTFCKTSKGGFNLEQVQQWIVDYLPDGQMDLYIRFSQTDSSNTDRQVLSGTEAYRALEILQGVCIFDATVEKSK